jgi:Kef-type K+ transport system membrane component KefB
MHDAGTLLLSLFLIFTTAKVAAELFEWMRQPGIAGEILAGVLLGPGVLKLVEPNELLTAVAQIGVLFLLFRVGLEVKASELIRVGPTATLVAVLGVLVPFTGGWAVLAYTGAARIESLFVGAAMVATSVGITARVLAERKLLQERASRVILAAAVIDDVLGLLILAIVSGLSKGQINYLELGGTALLAIGFMFLVVRFGARATGHVIPLLEKRLHASELQFHLALVLLLGLSLLAQYAGVAAIIGAFLAGMTLSETVSVRVHVLSAGVSEFLTPFFLAGIGLNLDISVFAKQNTVILALVILAVAIISKMIGCGLGAWKLGRSDMFRIGAGMVPRGEVGMVVAQIGASFGVISKDLFAVVVFMAVATTMVAPALLNIAWRSNGKPAASSVLP